MIFGSILGPIGIRINTKAVVLEYHRLGFLVITAQYFRTVSIVFFLVYPSQLAIPVQSFFIVVKIQLFCHSRLFQGLENQLLFFGSQRNVSPASFIVKIVSEVFRQSLFKEIILLGQHAFLHVFESERKERGG